jgi:hypothetical protein
MNRRNFITSTAIVISSINLFGLFNQTYKSEKSIFTNEELTKWCEKNGGYYVQNDELVHAWYQNKSDNPNAYKDPTKSFRHSIFGIPSQSDKYEALNFWLIWFRSLYGHYTFIINDVYYPNYTIGGNKLMPTISYRYDKISNKRYKMTDPIFDIKTCKYIIPMYEIENENCINITGFKNI